jgi:hypothetical protein
LRERRIIVARTKEEFEVDETFPDVGSMSNEELKALIDELKNEEREVSYRRRLLHGKIDLLRAELVNRLRTKHEAGDELIKGSDVQALTDILLGKVETPVGEDG